MMNKQKVIDEIEDAIPDFILNDYQRGKENRFKLCVGISRRT